MACTAAQGQTCNLNNDERGDDLRKTNILIIWKDSFGVNRRWRWGLWNCSGDRDDGSRCRIKSGRRGRDSVEVSCAKIMLACETCLLSHDLFLESVALVHRHRNMTGSMNNLNMRRSWQLLWRKSMWRRNCRGRDNWHVIILIIAVGKGLCREGLVENDVPGVKKSACDYVVTSPGLNSR
jgi:hypothetical protein